MAERANAAELPWVEKYRPQEVTDMVGSEEATSRLQAIAEEGNTPNLIFAGPPGTGKTTGVMCLARSLLGESMNDGVLELNASDDRGIDVVRNKIKMFAQKKLNLPSGRHKLVFLDEADSMTSAAQQAMRRTMEIHSHSTRFALACNQSEKIIEPIQSRCAIVRFTRLSDEHITSRLKHVVESERVAYSPEGLGAIVFTADGDMRQAINNLQSTHSGFGYIDPESVYKVCDQPHPKTAARALDACKLGDIDSAHAEIKSLWDYGYSALDVVGTLFRVCKSAELPEHLKLEFSKQIGFCHMRAAEGVNSMLQLDGLLAKLCRTASAAGSATTA